MLIKASLMTLWPALPHSGRENGVLLVGYTNDNLTRACNRCKRVTRAIQLFAHSTLCIKMPAHFPTNISLRKQSLPSESKWPSTNCDWSNAKSARTALHSNAEPRFAKN